MNTIVGIGKYNERRDDGSTITIPEDQVESFIRFADKYMVPEPNSICKCQRKTLVKILEGSDGVAYIDFEDKEICVEIFDNNDRSKRDVMSIKYCPFCGREL